MSRWTDIKARWSAGWKALQEQAIQTWGAAIEAKPQDFAPRVEATVAELRAARAHLDAIKPLLPTRLDSAEDQATFARFSALSRRYHELAAGVFADAEHADQVGAGPLLIVAGLGLGLAAIAWAVAAYQYARNLREQTALAHAELTARVQASEQGRELPPSTLPAQPPPAAPSKSSLGWLLVASLTLAAGAAVLPAFKKGA